MDAMESVRRKDEQRTRELKRALDAQNWSIRRELERLAVLIGTVLLCLASSSFALFMMLLPVNAARDPWRLFFEGGLGDSAWVLTSVAIAVGMFAIMLKDFAPKIPRLRPPK